ncbi:MAG TPA: hypothetical protein VFD32_19905 [Dehalococcoidia bacterium]|nr:hypothetical protein [Dehalococcoidia bacterium]
MARNRNADQVQVRRPSLVSVDLAQRSKDGSGDGTMTSLMQKLPSAGDTREAVSSAAQRAVDWGRDALSSARDQFSDVSLPDTLQNVSLPGRKPKRRSRMRWWLIGLIGLAAAAAFVGYRWMQGSSEEDDLYAEDWPAEPSNTPGAGNEPHEDDRTAELDAEQTLDVRQASGAPAGVNQP